MLAPTYSYEATLADSMKISWKVDDLIGGQKRLDFGRPFMPESLAGVRGLSSLDARERRLLNQIRGNHYLYMFELFERAILPFVLDEARDAVGSADPFEVRALATFAEEEGKHIQLFKRFAEEFAAGFGTPCGLMGPADDILKAFMSFDRLAVALVILMVEWASQAHYVDSIKDDQDLEPLFKSLLRHHWMEEAQHAKLDTLVVHKIARAAGPEGVAKGLADFITIIGLFDQLLAYQIQLDIASLEAASGRALGEAERAEIFAVQRPAIRYTVLASGLMHKSFLATVEHISPGAAGTLQALARELCPVAAAEARPEPALELSA